MDNGNKKWQRDNDNQQKERWQPSNNGKSNGQWQPNSDRDNGDLIATSMDDGNINWNDDGDNEDRTRMETAMMATSNRDAGDSITIATIWFHAAFMVFFAFIFCLSSYICSSPPLHQPLWCHVDNNKTSMERQLWNADATGSRDAGKYDNSRTVAITSLASLCHLLSNTTAISHALYTYAFTSVTATTTTFPCSCLVTCWDRSCWHLCLHPELLTTFWNKSKLATIILRCLELLGNSQFFHIMTLSATTTNSHSQ